MALNGIVMNTRRLRPKCTLGTMLLVVGWSSVVVWLNVRERIEFLDTDDIHEGAPAYLFQNRITPNVIEGRT